MENKPVDSVQDSDTLIQLEKPKRNIWVIVAIVLFILLIGVSTYAYNLSNNKKTTIKTPTPSKPVATITQTNQIVLLSPTITTVITQQPTTLKTVLQSVTLKVAAIGGGAGGERYDYAFTFNTDPKDQIAILKAVVGEITFYPGYNQGALDTGMVIKHGTVDLEITPKFEGAGSTTLKRKTSNIITNTALTDAPIYRINQSDVYIPQGSNYVPRTGSKYTLAYKEKPEDCSEWSQNTPACYWSQGVTTKGGYDLSVFCTAEDEKALWCDEIVKSLNVTVSKYPN